MENDISPKEKFIEIQELFKKMSHEIMCVIVQSFYIWRTLTFSRSTPEVGKETAEKNLEILKLHKDFLMPTEQSHLHVFVIGLMKFFDKHDNALSFNNLKILIEKNRDSFTPEVLRSVLPHLEKVDAVTEDYVPVKEEDIEFIETITKKHERLISSLKDIRNKQFAHTDMESINGNFIPNQVEELIQDTQEIFNRLSLSFDRSSTMWDHMKKDSISGTKLLLENLERGNKVRLEEIEKKLENYQ